MEASPLVGAFVVGLAVLNRLLRTREREGAFDVPSSFAARPGLRRFFDYGPGGWNYSGMHQRPVGSA